MPDETVFIVDDDLASAASLQALMMSAGFQVEVYHTAEDFLANYGRGGKGCLVLDIRLEGMSGLDLQNKLASQQESLPIIMISGNAENTIRRQAIAGGALAVLEKPFVGRKLCEYVCTAMRSQGQD